MVGTTPARGGCRAGGRLPTNGRIAFSANPVTDLHSENAGAPGDIYTVEPDGSSRRRLTHTLDAEQPAWSPDGRQIAYVRTDWRDEVVSRPWLMNADGSNQHPLAKNLLGRSPAWSPDGDNIAVSGEHGLTLINVHTGQQRQLLWSVRHWNQPDEPVWSADGEHLMVVAWRSGRGPDDYTTFRGLFTIRSSDGRGVAKLPDKILGFDWSATNCQVVFGSGLDTRGGDCNGDLFITDDRLQASQLLLAFACRQKLPVWAPDGRHIAFQHYAAILSTLPDGLWVANSDGSDAHLVVAPLGKSNALNHDVAWQPVP